MTYIWALLSTVRTRMTQVTQVCSSALYQLALASPCQSLKRTSAASGPGRTSHASSYYWYMSQYCHFDATSSSLESSTSFDSDAACWFELSHIFEFGSNSDPRQV